MRYLIVIPAIVFAATSIAPATADTVAGSTITSVSDTPDKFAASGRLFSADTAIAAVPANPPDPPVAAQPENNGLDTDGFNVAATPPGSWNFKIKHKTAGPWQAAGAVGLQLCIEGNHVTGPHQGPAGSPDDADPQALPEYCSKARNQRFGVAAARKTRTAYRRDKHLLEGGGNHIDHYGVMAVVAASPVATGNQVEGVYQVGGNHSTLKTRPSDLYGYAIGSGPDAGSTVAYDSKTQTLTFSIGDIDILDDAGGNNRQIDGSYYGDPVIEGTLTLGDLQLLGQTEDGFYRFGPGTVLLTDPNGNFELEGNFSEYLVDETVGGEIVTSYALLDTMSVENLTEESEGYSLFMDNFAGMTVLRRGIPGPISSRMAGIDVTFLTPTDLVEETAGFTESAELPMTIIIALNSGSTLAQ